MARRERRTRCSSRSRTAGSPWRGAASCARATCSRCTTSARSWCCSARAPARRACSTRSARTSARTSAHGGRVMGETMRCPFHGWQFDGQSGACTHDPVLRAHPAARRACARGTVHRAQRHGLRLAPRRGEAAGVGLPAAARDRRIADWSEPRTFELMCPRTCRTPTRTTTTRCTSSSCTASLETPPSAIELRRRTAATTASSSTTRSQGRPAARSEMTLVRDSWGLGLTAVRTRGHPDAGLLMYSSTTPIDETQRALALAAHRHEEPRRHRRRGVHEGPHRRACSRTCRSGRTRCTARSPCCARPTCTSPSSASGRASSTRSRRRSKPA